MGTHFSRPDDPNYGQFQDGPAHGKIIVNISGGTIGNPHEYVYTPDPLHPEKTLEATIGGNVFAGCMGRINLLNGDVNPRWPSLGKAKETVLNISEENSLVPTIIKSSVYGGGQFGTVRDNATVNISGGTIGTDVKHPDYNTNHKHYHFGSVYGAGFGSNDIRFEGDYANDSTANGLYKRPVEIAGRVYGNTFVNISGGQVLENVFGGGELASIGMVKNNNLINGVATVTMTGGQVGPLDMTGLNGYVYGGTEGVAVDLNGDFKNYSNVNETHVTVEEGTNTSGEVVSSPRVWGSLFGGGSDGHVLGNANVTFNGGTLGTWGTTTWDGNIFGGGRNYRATSLTSGRVGGNINVTMTGGTMLGNIYGGGRLASTGVDVNGDFYTTDLNNHGNIVVNVTGGTIGYEHLAPGCHDANDQIMVDPLPWAGQIGGTVFGGAMGEDITPDLPNPGINPNNYTDAQFEAYTNYIRSRIGWVRSAKVTIGGLSATPVLVKGCVFGGGKSGRVKTDTEVTIEGNSTIGVDRGNPEHQMPQMDLDKLKFSGSVYGAGLGSERSVALFEEQQPSTTWPGPEVGRVYGNASVYIKNNTKGTPKILNNIYGGGALSGLGTLENGNYVANTGYTYVEMSGGELGPLDMSGVNAYVFAGGQGQPSYDFKDYGKVYTTHLVVEEEARVFGSLFGGGEDGHVVSDALIDMNGGTLGTTGETTWDGNIFGGGRNYSAQHKTTGRVGGNITVNVRKGELLGSVFGGGRLGSVGVNDLDGNAFAMQEGNDHGFITVNIGGDDENSQLGDIVIGHDAYNDHDKVGGNVYGGGKGIAGPSTSIYPDLAQVKQTTVNVKEREGNFKTWIKGSVFGSGEDGHVLQNTYVNIYDGQIGGEEYTTDVAQLTPCEDYYHGNVYGGGRGIDTYTQDGQQHYSHTAGHVGWNTFVNIYGGRIVRSVYGGGNLSSVGNPEETPDENGNYQTGLATVNIVGGTIGFDGEGDSQDYEYRDYGNVFGSGHGIVGADGYDEYRELAYVKNTHVTIDSVAMVYGSVFGGGEDGHVRRNTLVDVLGGVIGQEGEDFLHGNVYGGGRGLVHEADYISPTAGVVYGHTIVNIMQSNRKKTSTTYYTPEIWNNVYGGGSRSVVNEYKVVNMSAGIVHDHVFGGSRDIPAVRPNNAPRWVNMWGGTICGNLYGCSHNSNDGVIDDDNHYWASLINLSGGTIRGNVFGAGYGGDQEGIIIHGEHGGLVDGSVGILIGKNAIQSANQTEIGGANSHVYLINNEVPYDSLNIFGNVYAGADQVYNKSWGYHPVSGYSNIYIDGTGYDSERITGAGSNPYMYIGSNGGGIFGSGNNCEAGEEGHNILVRNYGHRNSDTNHPNELVHATRSLTTIQRAENVIIDHTNINLSGLADISNTANPNKYGVMRVSDTLAVINAGGIVLGSTTAGDYAHMDSIYSVQSLNLLDNDSIYTHKLNELNKHSWYWVGIKDGSNNAKLYNISGTGTNAQVVGELTFAQENVVIYNDTSKLWVRYHDKKPGDATSKQYYGELLGFFRMRGDYYHPTLKDDESFAYARPKITDDIEIQDDNIADGGWLSYNTEFNYFTDEGEIFTKTIQYPYINVLDYTRGDREDYRMWVDKSHKRRWYVDGTRGWGRDDKKKFKDQSGLFPDKPKYTLYGKDANGKGVGIVNENYIHSDQLYLNYSHKDDVIYVVGAISAADEKEMLRDSTYTNDETFYPLKLYRYPGGHIMSNGKRDYGGAKQAIWGQPNGEENDELAAYRGPGANYGALLNVQGAETVENAASLEMRGVLMDGLYGYTEADSLFHEINDPSLPVVSKFNPALDTLPLVLTHRNSMLTMHGHTVLKRGYNNQNAEDWYTDSDYKSYRSSGKPIYNGGAIFVDSLAIVNVSGLDSIVGNKQYLKIGDGTAEIIESNVYQPTFNTHLNITDALDPVTRIGVTSPNRNKEPNYVANTFSPVAVATRQGVDENHQPYSTLDARSAWENNNFYDDLNWFFVKGHVDDNNARTTYYGALNEQFDRVSFGWTWANVVRKQPEGYAVVGNAISISSEQGLAWLISVVNGMNKQTASDLNETTVSLATAQTDIKDIYDMQQYVWVPVGGNPSGQPFAGTFDGNGHLITELYVDYLGKGDRIYKYNEYGMFGRVNGTIDRTFLVSGMIRPDCTIDLTEAQTYNVGGLVGILNGTVSNSEAAMEIKGPKKDNLSTVAGGLVGQMNSGEVHSSMAVPDITVGPSSTMAGLVGSSTTGNINNSFVHAKLTVDGNVKTNINAGGLLGVNNGAKMENCYLASITPTNLTGIVYDSIVASNSAGTVNYSYVMTKYTGTSVDTHCGYYAPVITADELGYMYADNRVNTGSTTDTTLFVQLNNWVDGKNGTTGHKYARWARPGLPEINGDLPVLLLSEYDKTTAHQGGFRSMGTYKGGPVLQYGGPVRDVNEVGTALTRSQANVSKKDNLFIYGDVVNNISLPTGKSITQEKVSIYEHASIKLPGDLADFENTYVGITFDNSSRVAYSSAGINFGLVGMGGFKLSRDWHMLSTPLSHAPLGFDYQETNHPVDGHTNFNEVDHDKVGLYNNPWVYYNDTIHEFSWLQTLNSGGNNRYWMKGYASADGYFPTQRGALFSESSNPTKPLASEIGKLFVENSDEYPGTNIFRYPYGMDFFTWTEPDYHWINFKRNGPNHWHSDANEVTGHHDHIDYKPVLGATLNVNEEELIVGRGYMAAISIPTFLQSHGKLNHTTSEQSVAIMLTKVGAHCKGWNLVGNPFHGYLDFDAFAKYNELGDDAAYVVYDADGYKDYPESAFLYYPKQGSENGAYAGRYLHPHQGFFLFASSDEQSIVFNESSIVAARASLGTANVSDGHYRGENLPRYPLVNLFLNSDNGCSDVTVIEFERPEWGGAMKLTELRNGNGLFYGYHEGKRYAALFAEEGTTRVPLWFEAKEDDIFTLKWNTANGDFTSLYLIDNIKGIEYDMLANDTYTFEGHKQDYYSRFYIVFNVNDVEEHHEYNIAFFDGSQWVVTGEGELDFIDLQGRVLWHGRLSGGQTRVNFPVVAKGMYMLRLVNSNETKVQKIIVK